MTYPVQCPRVYVNPEGMVSASGYYRASTTQEIANMLPPWMHLRENPNSIGQQFISGTSVHLKRLETTLNDCMKNKFLETAVVDDIDILYRAKLPSNVNILDASASGIRCIAAPSGCSPSGINQIYLDEVSDLQTFYYNVVPTRIEVDSPASVSMGWNITPSGIYDSEEKHVDVWGKKHDIMWCYSGGMIRKQDSETMEDYEVYPENRYGTIVDMDFYNGNLWCLTNNGSTNYVTILSSKTCVSNKASLDLIASFDITSSISGNPTKMIVEDGSNVYIKGPAGDTTYSAHPRYDYFLLDKDNRYVYMKEDYTDSGVFISNT